MLKNKLKTIVLFTIIALIFTFSFTTVFATIDDVASEDQATTKAVPQDESGENVTPISEVTSEVTPTDESGDTRYNSYTRYP